MKKPRKDRGTEMTQVAPIIALLMLLIANGHVLVITFRPLCG
jgi:hypothetical protein